MPKKNKNRKQQRKDKRLEFSLSKNVVKINEQNQTKKIDQSYPINDEMPDYDEEMKENFLISFVHYKINQCGLIKLTKPTAKQLVKKLKSINDTKIKELSSSNLIKDDVRNNGEYAKLYKDLSPDIEIKEIDFSGAGRIFAHFIRRYVYIVAIDPIHKNIH